jgi:hypothetical protein
MSTATDMLEAYQAAEQALLKGQMYRFGDRQLTMANLPEIQGGRREWERRVSQENAAAAGVSQSPIGVIGADFSGGRAPCRDGWWPE